MKLFQRLLVAPAAIGLLSPLASNATEVDLNEISKFSKVENLEIVNSFDKQDKTSQLIAGGEGLVSDISSDSFSETTSASFSADFAVGAVDGDTTGEAVNAIYGFQIDLNTSFTGEDSFDVSIDAGSSAASLDQLDLNSTSSDVLVVDGISYTFPLGDKTTVFFGDSMDGSTLYNTACVYGGQTINIDDCGNSGAAMAAGMGTAAGASYDFGNGWTAAIGYEGQGSTASKGLMTKEGLDVFGGQVTYTGDNYGVSVTYSDYEGSSSDTAYTAFNGYFTPESAGSLPSISVGYETGNKESATVTDTSQFMVGLQWDEVGAGTLGVALATDGHMLDTQPERYVYEAFYSYPVNDGMTITPIVFIREASSTVDETGVVLKTSFSF